MPAVILGGVAAAYCATWLVAGLGGRPIPNNLMRMVAKGDPAFHGMVVAYAAGLALALGVVVMGVRGLQAPTAGAAGGLAVRGVPRATSGGAWKRGTGVDCPWTCADSSPAPAMFRRLRVEGPPSPPPAPRRALGT